MARYNTTSDIKRMWKNIRLFTIVLGTIIYIGWVLLIMMTRQSPDDWTVIFVASFFGVFFYPLVFFTATGFLINLDMGDRKISEFPLEYRDKRTKFLKLDYLSSHGMGGLDYYRDVMKKMAIDDSTDDSK